MICKEIILKEFQKSVKTGIYQTDTTFYAPLISVTSLLLKSGFYFQQGHKANRKTPAAPHCSHSGIRKGGRTAQCGFGRQVFVLSVSCFTPVRAVMVLSSPPHSNVYSDRFADAHPFLLLLLLLLLVMLMPLNRRQTYAVMLCDCICCTSVNIDIEPILPRLLKRISHARRTSRH